MKLLLANRRGQFTIIAAILVAIVLVGAVVSTYSAIRYSSLEEQPQVLSSIDEVNLALKQILGFTVGYYGSVLQVTGNTTYARQLATNYLQSGLINIGDVRPEWAPSFDITTLDLRADWYSNQSYSYGNLSITYDLPGIGISGITYSVSSRLDVQIQPSVGNQACLNITKDGSEPLVDIPLENMEFYRYVGADLTWEQVSPSSAPIVYANGTYLIDLPSEVMPDSYMIKVEDSRGIMVLSSSFTSYTGTLIRNSTYTGPDFVDVLSDVDSSPDKGIHSNFAAQQQAPDFAYDNLVEANIGGGLTNFTLVDAQSFEESFPPSDWTKTGGWHKESIAPYYYHREHSAGFDRQSSSASYLTTPSFDCRGVNAIYVDFWFYDDGCDNDEFRLEYFNGRKWDKIYQLGNDAEGQWIHFQHKVDPKYYIQSFSVRFNANPDYNYEHAYVDLVTIIKEVDVTNYQLDIEEQWTNVNYTNAHQDLCIKAESAGTEQLNIDVWNEGVWVNIGSLTGLVNGWKNISVTDYIDGSTFTIRFRDSISASDSSQNTWRIDAVLLATKPDIDFLLSQQESTITVEWLQNGTMRWLGQNIEQVTEAKPIPPIPVKGIHLNQTISGVNKEVPFQIEDWASDYRIPLGLTSNATVFSNKQMIVFQLDNKVTDFTLWWDGNDDTVQTSYAYTNRSFSDTPSSNTLNNGRQRLQFSTSGFTLTSTVGTVTTTAELMRINGDKDDTAPELSYVIYNGVVRDIVLGEAEYSSGIANSPNVYTNIVISLPANVTYYTYQLRLMFISSSLPRTLNDVCPIKLSTSASSVVLQTENGTSEGFPLIQNGTGTFSNYEIGDWTAHHWSQFITNDGKKGSGLMFTDIDNQKLYVFDSMPSSTSKGAIEASSGSIELLPVSQSSVSFTTPLDVTWSGAVVTSDNTTPICKLYDATTPMGLWILVEYPPTITVTAKS
jgi:hypothetical protein